MSDKMFKVKKGINIQPVDSTTVVNPKAGDVIVDSSDNDKLKKYSVATSSFEEISGSGSAINYVENSDFENNVTGHTTYKDVAGEVPTTGTGGTPTIVISRSEVDPLVGVASGLVEKGALDTQGEGINVTLKDFDNADKARIQIISFEYDASDANYVDGDYRVYFLDNTNSKVIRVNGEDIKGGKGTHYARIQVPIDCDNGSILIHCATTNANAIDFKYDRISMAPQIINTGTFVTDWKAYSPAVEGFGAISNNSLEWRRVGDSIEIRGGFTSGVSTASQARIPFPSGLTVGQDASYTTMVGTYIAHIVQTSSGGAVLAQTGESFLKLSSVSVFSNVSVAANNPVSGNAVASNGTTITVSGVSVPIQGWSANTQTSEDFGGRDVIVEAAGNSGQTIIAGSPLVFNSVEDSTASWDGSILNVPESGVYIYTGVLDPTSLPGTVAILESINGVSGKSSTYRQAPNANDVLQFTGIVRLSKGDTFFLFCSDTLTLATNPVYSHLHIQKLASSQQILETERVAARYTSDSGQSIPNSSNYIVVFEDIEEDTHAAYNSSTGRYTFPISGWYTVSARFTLGGAAVLGKRALIGLAIDGSGIEDILLGLSASSGVGGYALYTTSGTTVKYFEKNQTLDFIINQDSGSSQSLNSSGANNYFSIARIK